MGKLFGKHVDAAHPSSSSVAPLVYGFDQYKCLAFRHPQGKSAELEYSLRPTVAADIDPYALLECFFADGTKFEIKDFTVAEFRELESKNRGGSNTRLFEITSEISHQLLHIAQRPDRNWLLVSVYDNGKQIGQVKACFFGELPGSQPCTVPNSTPAIEKATSFLKPYVLQWSKGEYVDSDSFKVAIKEGLTDQGFLSVKKEAGKTCCIGSCVCSCTSRT